MSDEKTIIFDFNKNTNISIWQVVDDGVMGGLSQGNLKINDVGNGIFYGFVSTKNNGGFSSIRYRFSKKNVAKYSKIILKIKGDGKNYQLRIKNNSKDYYSYVKPFITTQNWSLIEIKLSDMYPTFRGRKLNIENFSEESIEELAILIGNKKNEQFQLEIDKIYLQ
ncbi:CIA30 family protein [Polaribacter porphyrae]|uniref:CIA30 family protein n=2 Tax=Polaribacter porphyrae TaxID=1137780 RepID=A0A2S7WTP7_9FLAO|nr:CIA30 family protein [Polaribacter porphyrae]